MILVPYRITEKFIRAHPELTFVYSSDLQGKGGLGMQWHMAGPPNSFPVPTLIKFCANSEYFYDDTRVWDYEVGCWRVKDSAFWNHIEPFIKAIPLDKPIIVPYGIGRGCSKMNEKAPKLYDRLRNELIRIKSNEYKIDYTKVY